jgi:hypothetical protein
MVQCGPATTVGSTRRKGVGQRTPRRDEQCCE